MEDLASVVLTKLKVEDGPSPFCLLYRYACMGRFSRVMCIRAVRNNGIPAYEVALCNAYWRFGKTEEEDAAAAAASQRPKPRWQIALFENEKVAATFAIAFLELQPRNHRDGDPDMITYASKDVAHLFEYEEDGTACLGVRFDNGDLSLYGANQLGQYTITCAADLQTAMLTLMPLSSRIH